MPDQSQPRESHTDGTVLIAYDGSNHAKAAVEQAGRELLTPRRAVVLNVQTPLDSTAMFGSSHALVPDDVMVSIAEQAGRVAEEGAELALRVGFDAEALVKTGDPIWQQIIDAADEVDAAIIAIGSHGRTGLDRVMMGSVANAVVQHSNLPVFIARTD